jgi:hypothetical protein
MTQTTNTIKECSWDDLFEQATEDISTYLWAVSEWEEPDQEYASDYLALLMISSRNRSRIAETKLKNAPSDYKGYVNKLSKMKKDAELTLSEQMAEHQQELSQIISHDFKERLSEIKSLLLKVRDAAIDGDLYDDQEWFHDSHQRYAKHFLIQFGDMAVIVDELQKEPFKTLQTNDFQKTFHEIDQEFRKYFGYFFSETIVDFISYMKNREYESNYWWLNKKLKADDIEENYEMFEQLMSEFKTMYQNDKIDKTDSCSMMESTIAYGMKELDPLKNLEVFNHIVSCPFCRKLLIDIQFAFGKEEQQYEKADEQLPQKDNCLNENINVWNYPNIPIVDGKSSWQWTPYFKETESLSIPPPLLPDNKNNTKFEQLNRYYFVEAKMGDDSVKAKMSDDSNQEKEEFIEFPQFSKIIIHQKNDDNKIVLIDEDTNQDILKKFCSHFKELFFSAIIVQQQDKWIEITEKPEQENNTIVLKNVSVSRFLWIVNTDALYLEDSVELLIDALNQNTKPDFDEIFDTSIMWVEIVSD